MPGERPHPLRVKSGANLFLGKVGMKYPAPKSRRPMTKEHKRVGTAAQVSHGSSIVSDTMTGTNIIVCSVLFERILWNFCQRIDSTPAHGSSALVSVSKARIAPQR